MRDNYDLWVEHDQREQEWLDSLPICEECGEPIQEDHCYNIDGEILCEECLKERYRVRTSELMR